MAPYIWHISAAPRTYSESVKNFRSPSPCPPLAVEFVVEAAIRCFEEAKDKKLGEPVSLTVVMRNIITGTEKKIGIDNPEELKALAALKARINGWRGPTGIHIDREWSEIRKNLPCVQEMNEAARLLHVTGRVVRGSIESDRADIELCDAYRRGQRIVVGVKAQLGVQKE